MKLDILTRSTRDLSELLDLFTKADAALVSVSENLDTASARGRIGRNILGVVAQWERKAIAEGTASALAQKRRSRTVYWPTSFGFVREGNELIAIPEERRALDAAMRMDKADALFREIGRFLTHTGVIPDRGKAWHAESVRVFLRSKIANVGAQYISGAAAGEYVSNQFDQPGILIQRTIWPGYGILTSTLQGGTLVVSNYGPGTATAYGYTIPPWSSIRLLNNPDGIDPALAGAGAEAQTFMGDNGLNYCYSCGWSGQLEQ